MSDLIRREDIRTALKENVIEMGGDDWEPGIHRDDIDAIVNSVPAADRPRGEWIEDNLGIVICSECKRPRRDNRVNHINFCNSCGARMKGADDE